MYRSRKRFLWIPIFAVAALSLLVWVIMYLWNTVLVAVVVVRPITFWQAAGLFLLSRLLVGGWPGGGRSRHGGGPGWRGKWQQMSDEEKQQFKEKMRARYGPR
jgi:Ca2+/H+ antiporter, TMEM165/GDT1 family